MPAPETLKVSIGYFDSYVGEGQFSYAGPGALARAKLALQIVEERLKLTGVATTELRLEIIGVDSVHRGPLVGSGPEPRGSAHPGCWPHRQSEGRDPHRERSGDAVAQRSSRRRGRLEVGTGGDRGRVHVIAPFRNQDQRGV